MRVFRIRRNKTRRRRSPSRCCRLICASAISCVSYLSGHFGCPMRTTTRVARRKTKDRRRVAFNSTIRPRKARVACSIRLKIRRIQRLASIKCKFIQLKLFAFFSRNLKASKRRSFCVQPASTINIRALAIFKCIRALTASFVRRVFEQVC